MARRKTEPKLITLEIPFEKLVVYEATYNAGHRSFAMGSALTDNPFGNEIEKYSPRYFLWADGFVQAKREAEQSPSN